MSELRRKTRAGFAGRADEALRSLLADVLEVELVELPQRPELIFAIIGPRDPFRVLAAVQVEELRQVPILAILPITDERLAARAIQAGAACCWPLDGTLQGLRAAVASALAAVRPVSGA